MLREGLPQFYQMHKVRHRKQLIAYQVISEKNTDRSGLAIQRSTTVEWFTEYVLTLNYYPLDAKVFHEVSDPIFFVLSSWLSFHLLVVALSTVSSVESPAQNLRPQPRQAQQ